MAFVHRRAFVAASAAAVVAPKFARAQAPGANNMDNMLWGSMTHAERDAAYDVAAAVSDSAQIIAGLASASAKLRSQRSKHLDLAYGPGERNKWDLFPGDNSKAPCLVFFHGGYWQGGNRERNSCLAEGVLAQGWSAALPGYTLAPAATLTQIVREVRSSLDWLAAQGSAQGIAGPVIISGHSAGGHLAALMLDHPSVRAGLASAGIFELGPIRDTYLNDRLKLTDEEVAGLSPLRLPSVRKPLAITYGTAELPALVRNSREYHAHRAQSHCPGQLIPVPNANHFTILEEFRSPNGILTRAVMRLMEDAA
jgi:arylformamidase